jgi:hypothetical protein
MRTARRAWLAALVLPLAACGDGGPPEPTFQEVMQARCLDLGGAYFEYEATSAGSHIWCVKPDGASIHLDGGE